MLTEEIACQTDISMIDTVIDRETDNQVLYENTKRFRAERIV